jgi:hypothetical protein
MQASGTLMLCGLLGRTGSLALLSGVLGAAILALLGMRVLRGRFYKNLVVAVGFTALPVALYLVADARGDSRLFFDGACWILAALTWVSGLDYLVGGLPRLRAAGGFGRADAVRVIAAAAMPLLALLLLTDTAAPPWAVLALLAFELAVGGLDNMLSLHGVAAPALPWGVRAVGAAALLGAGLILPAQAAIAAIAAAVVSGLGAASEFWRGRSVYLA